MSLEVPATICVLGAGPIGLEAALYARFLGYEVCLFERGQIGEHVRSWGHVTMFTPFGMNVSPLGMAAIQAQNPRHAFPGADALLTGQQWLEAYLQPLAQTDLLADALIEHCAVEAIGRSERLKADLVGDDARAATQLHLLARNASGEEATYAADAVLDCTGTLGQPNWLGPGGVPAVGERRCERIERRLPDVLGKDRSLYEGRRVLVVGAGYSAATTVVALGVLMDRSPATQVTWLTRRDADATPIAQIARDRLLERDALARRANDLARSGRIDYRPASWVEGIRPHADDGALEVQLAGLHEGAILVDRIVANVGFRPDTSLYDELQVHTCYATAGPMKLAAALMKNDGLDCLSQPPSGPAALVNPEPDFYILGAKSYGRRGDFLYAQGLAQIRDLFTILMDRPGLDLYGTTLPRDAS